MLNRHKIRDLQLTKINDRTIKRVFISQKGGDEKWTRNDFTYFMIS